MNYLRIDSIICNGGPEECEVKRLRSIRKFHRCTLMAYRAMLKRKDLPTGLLDPEDNGTTWQVFARWHGARSETTWNFSVTSLKTSSLAWNIQQGCMSSWPKFELVTSKTYSWSRTLRRNIQCMSPVSQYEFCKIYIYIYMYFSNYTLDS